MKIRLRIRYPHSSQLIQKAFNLIAAHTGQPKNELRLRYARIANISPDTVRAWQSGTARPHRREEIASIARDGMNIGQLDPTWLHQFLRVVDAPTDLRTALMRELVTSAQSASPFDLIFADGHEARGIEFDDGQPAEGCAERLAAIPAGLGVPANRPSLVLIGGAAGLDAETAERLRPMFNNVLAPLCESLQLTVLDGGTDSGVMKLMGEARAHVGGTFPLIGVVADQEVSQPGAQARQRIGLAPNHSHFVFLSQADWQTQARWLATIATQFAGAAPSLTVLANGGTISVSDLFYSLQAKRPVLVLDGSGRLANDCAAALRGERCDAHTSAMMAVGLGVSARVEDAEAIRGVVCGVVDSQGCEWRRG